MKPAGKIALAATGILVLGGSVYVGGLLKKKSAGDKLVINIEKTDAALDGLKGVNLKAKLSLANPTKESLEFSQPFARLFVNDKNGSPAEIGDSATSSAKTFIPPNSTKPLTLDVNIPFAKAIQVIPGFGAYIADRINGAKPTRAVKLKYTYTAYGLEQDGELAFKI